MIKTLQIRPTCFFLFLFFSFLKVGESSTTRETQMLADSRAHLNKLWFAQVRLHWLNNVSESLWAYPLCIIHITWFRTCLKWEQLLGLIRNISAGDFMSLEGFTMKGGSFTLLKAFMFICRRMIMKWLKIVLLCSLNCGGLFLPRGKKKRYDDPKVKMIGRTFYVLLKC